MSDETVEQANERYLAAMHAMQSGVETKQQLDPSDTTPKNLRVGVNSAMVQQAALIKLLISKGVITEEEWFTAVADGAEQEVQFYQDWLSKTLNMQITLR